MFPFSTCSAVRDTPTADKHSNSTNMLVMIIRINKLSRALGSPKPCVNHVTCIPSLQPHCSVRSMLHEPTLQTKPLW